jgi:hypothetical protein
MKFGFLGVLHFYKLFADKWPLAKALFSLVNSFLNEPLIRWVLSHNNIIADENLLHI